MATQTKITCVFAILTTLFFFCTYRITWAVNKFGALAIGADGEDIGAIVDAGAVNIIYGSTDGLSSTNNQLWYQDSEGVADAGESYDCFGNSLATGDFNNDGFMDLAVGIPYEDIGAIGNAGAVNIIYGSTDGLSSVNSQLWSQDSDGIADDAEPGDGFGSSLAAGDFNNDGFSDLAVGVFAEDIGAFTSAGVVNIIYGSTDGLSSTNDQLWSQGSEGIIGKVNSNDIFGNSLATGDFNNDGFMDLAVGVPHENIGVIVGAGAVNIIYGSTDGLSSANNQRWSQDSEGIAGSAESYDRFGNSLATGDFNNDGFMDLAVGAFYEDIMASVDAGAVHIIYGSTDGLSSVHSQVWSQFPEGIVGDAESYDYFGNSLATGDFNGDSFMDLAVGVFAEDIGAFTSAGAVNIIYGSTDGLSSANNQLWSQDSEGIIGKANSNDIFGNSLATGDFNSDGFMDLAVGVPNEDIGAIGNAGAVNIIYGSTNGLSSTNNQLWSQESDGIADKADDKDHFGTSLVYIPPPRIFPWPIFLPAIIGGQQ